MLVPVIRYFTCALFALVAVILSAPAIGAETARKSTLAPGDYAFTLMHGGIQRTYRVHMPPQAAGGAPLPVVLNFHGAGSNGQQEEAFSKMDQAADAHGFIAVYPDGTGRFDRHFTWNAGFCCAYAMSHNIDDVGFTIALIDDLAARTPIMRRRVYATGMSNGGMMAYRLAAQASAHIAAAAPVAGSMVMPRFEPQRPIAIMAFNSVDDPLLHYAGGYGNHVRALFHRNLGNPGVEAGLARWVKYDGCSQPAQAAPPLVGNSASHDAGITATRYTWAPCKDGVEIVLWKLTGSGHTWPGGAQGQFERVLGRSTGLIDANEEMWRFFSRYELPR